MFTFAAANGGWKLAGWLTPVDIAVIVLLLVSAGMGYWTGFVWQLIRILSVAISIWVSWVYHPVIAGLLGARLSGPAARVTSALGVFVVCLLACYLLAFLFRRVINTLRRESPARVLGAVFGLAKGALLIGVIAFGILQYAGEDNPLRVHVARSAGARCLARSVGAVLQVLPGRVGQKVRGGQDVGRLAPPPRPHPFRTWDA